MTTISNAPATTPLTASRSTRITGVASLVSGAAFLVDTVTITIINRSFGGLDDALFLGGLLALAVALVGLSVCWSRRFTGARRVGVAALVFVGAFVVVGGLAQAMDAFGRHTFSTANVGLHGEWSFFTVGVVMLALGLWLTVSGRRSARG